MTRHCDCGGNLIDFRTVDTMLKTDFNGRYDFNGYHYILYSWAECEECEKRFGETFMDRDGKMYWENPDGTLRMIR